MIETFLKDHLKVHIKLIYEGMKPFHCEKCNHNYHNICLRRYHIDYKNVLQRFAIFGPQKKA